MYIQIISGAAAGASLISAACFTVLVASLVLLLFFRLYCYDKEVRGLKQVITEKEKSLTVSSQTITALKHDRNVLFKEKELKEHLIAIVIHDLKSPLRFLSMHMDKLQENLQDMNAEELKGYTLLLKNTVNDVYLFTQDILIWLNNQKQDFSIIRKKTNLKDLICQTARVYQDICEIKNNRIEIFISQNIQVHTASDLLNVIIRNLLDNANKFTHNGVITISALSEDKVAKITISDTGIGINKDKIDGLINPELNNWNIQATRNHLGYKIINDLIKKLGGSLQLTSELKIGTTVTISLPRHQE